MCHDYTCQDELASSLEDSTVLFDIDWDGFDLLGDLDSRGHYHGTDEVRPWQNIVVHGTC